MTAEPRLSAVKSLHATVRSIDAWVCPAGASLPRSLCARQWEPARAMRNVRAEPTPALARRKLVRSPLRQLCQRNS